MTHKDFRQASIFKSLPQKEFDHLISVMEEVELSAGSMLFEEGDKGNNFFLIIDGELEVIKAMGTENERLIAVRHEGDFLGEMSLLNPSQMRMASVRVKTDARLLRLAREEFDKVLYADAIIPNRILREISQRLNVAHEKTIVDLQIKNRELSIAYQDLKEAHEQIVEKERIDRELEVAHNIQISILPEKIPQIEGYGFSVFLEPARSVAGDFYDIFELPDGRIGVLIGDVTDKGVPAALVMAQTHALIYSAAITGAEPKEVFQRVNNKMLRLNKTGLFVTAIYGILDPAKKIFHYARAGHEVPAKYSGDKPATFLTRNHGQPLGLFEEPVFDLQEIRVESGTVLLLYTDGVLDMQNESGAPFGKRRMLEAFQESAKKKTVKICNEIYQELVSFQGYSDQTDDITMVIVKVE
jgi:sigma-B regulation protein RsbU (phosphoserine phosphatase)